MLGLLLRSLGGEIPRHSDDVLRRRGWTLTELQLLTWKMACFSLREPTSPASIYRLQYLEQMPALREALSWGLHCRRAPNTLNAY